MTKEGLNEVETKRIAYLEVVSYEKEKHKYYWKQLISYYAVVLLLIVSFTFTSGDSELSIGERLAEAVLFAGSIAIIVLGFKIANDFTKTAYPQKQSKEDN